MWTHLCTDGFTYQTLSNPTRTAWGQNLGLRCMRALSEHSSLLSCRPCLRNLKRSASLLIFHVQKRAKPSNNRRRLRNDTAAQNNYIMSKYLLWYCVWSKDRITLASLTSHESYDTARPAAPGVSTKILWLESIFFLRFKQKGKGIIPSYAPQRNYFSIAFCLYLPLYLAISKREGRVRQYDLVAGQ